MRLLFMTQNVDAGDAVLGFLPSWLRELASRVERLVVVTFQSGVPPALPANCVVRSLGRESGARGLKLLFNFRREVRRAVREDGCDTVLAHMVPKYAVLARRLALPREVPVYLWYTHAGVNRWLLWSEPLVEKIFTASEESLRIDTKKKVVTRHGIDTAYLQPGAAPARGRLVTVGRLTPSKDVETLLKATALLASGNPSIALDIVGGSMAAGDDDYGKRMRDLAQTYQIADRVRFPGFVAYRDILPVYRGAHLFVSASRTGSVDKAVLEAMACGALVLTSNDAFRSILPCEYQFRERDPEDFLRRAQWLLSLPEAERAARGLALRAIVERDHAVGPLMERLVREMSKTAVHVT
jgi:glycosyltransferase involved in cell wall biosynthesis